MKMFTFQLPLLQSSVSHNPSEIILICWIGALYTDLVQETLMNE